MNDEISTVSKENIAKTLTSREVFRVIVTKVFEVVISPASTGLLVR